MSSNVTYKYIRQNPDIHTYIKNADAAVAAQGYTEHSFAHVEKVADTVKMILEGLGCDERKVELGMIAAYMHDIGNVVNRIDHAQSGAMMAFHLLDKMGMPPQELATVVTAIGNHDEKTAYPVNEVAAALILADKSDVRRSRVRDAKDIADDIHDRVNYAAVSSQLNIEKEKGKMILDLTLDTEICPVMEYFEIFTERMLLCKRAAKFFGMKFGIMINGQTVM